MKKIHIIIMGIAVFVGLLLCAAFTFAGSYTPNLKMYKPSVGENNWGATVNSSNWDRLDSILKGIDSQNTSTFKVVAITGSATISNGTATLNSLYANTAAFSDASIAGIATIQNISSSGNSTFDSASIRQLGTAFFTSRYASLDDAHTAAAAISGSVLILDNQTTGSLTTTVPIIWQGGMITSGTVTFNAPFTAPLAQVFSPGVAVAFGIGSVSGVHPEWWGAKLDGTDWSSSLSNAIASQDSPNILLPYGHIRINSTIQMVSGLKITGYGPQKTVIESYVTTTALYKPAGTSQGYGLGLYDFTLKNMAGGGTGIEIYKENFINMERVEITALSASTPWTVAGIFLSGSVSDQQYNHSLYDVDVNFANVGLSLSTGYTNEIGLFKGRYRLCGTGIKIDGTSGVKLNGVNFAALSTTYSGPTYDGVAVHVLNGADVQSFGSRFENMNVAYRNGADNANNIMSVADIISSTSVSAPFWDGIVNLHNVSIFPRVSGNGVTNTLTVPSAKLLSNGGNSVTMENTNYDTIKIANQTSNAETFKITNETQGKTYLSFNHSGSQMSTDASIVTSGLTITVSGSALVDLNNSNYDNIRLSSRTSFIDSFLISNESQGVSYLWFQRDGTRSHMGLNSGATTWRSSLPSGSWTQGDIIYNTTPSILGSGSGEYTLLGYRRVTSTATNTAGVDWIEMRIPTSNTLPLSGTTNTFGGELLASIGTCTSGTASVAGATTSMTAIVQPSDGAHEPLVNVYGYVSAAGTVTVDECAIAAVTPAARRVYVRVIK